jgi:hypothetical protein
MAVNMQLSGTTQQVPSFIESFFILCQFEGKLTGTPPDSYARALCDANFFRLAVCLA